jgi:oxygen-independent coproporphyrinogen-3 oxidase
LTTIAPARAGPDTGFVELTPLPRVALYIHVPFCVSLCPYCDFVVYAGAAARGERSRVATFLAALHVELRLRADALDERFGTPGESGRPALGSLYLGGGTPSLLPADAVAELIALVDERFGLAGGAEVTLEANPGPDERGDAGALVRAGVTRLSIGAQSLDPVELRRLGRRHRPEDVRETVAAAREAGFHSVSLDLLYDVPGGSLETWIDTLDAALDLRPDHLSLYALTLDDPDAEGLTGPSGDHLPTTAGARRWRTAARIDQDDDRAAAQYRQATDRLAAAGWRGYEISNWARPGHESRHNLAYWERRPYEAVGPGAHAFDGEVRRWNTARLDAWVAALVPPGGGEPRLPPGGKERLDDATAGVERVILGLRTDLGLPAGAAAEPPLDAVVDWALANELVTVARAGCVGGDRIVLTTRGRLLSNELFARLV